MVPDELLPYISHGIAFIGGGGVLAVAARLFALRGINLVLGSNLGAVVVKAVADRKVTDEELKTIFHAAGEELRG